MDDVFELLDDYFKKTPKEVLKEKFDRYNNAKSEGVTVRTYLQNFAKNHNFLPSLADFQKDKVKKYGVSVFSQQIKETVSSLPINTKVEIKQEVSFTCETEHNIYSFAA